MKKVFLIAILIFAGSIGYSQSQTEEQLGNMGIMNGCRDAKAPNANERYLQIMQSSAQKDEYKAGYDQGWHACYKSSGEYYWYKGKLVFRTPKPDYGKGPKGKGHQTPWVIKVHDEQPKNRE